MTDYAAPIDISNIPELMRLAEEVEVSKTPRELKRKNKTVAMIVPVTQATVKKREKTKADYEAFLSAAGGWKDLDTDTLIANIYASRRRSNRPSVNL